VFLEDPPLYVVEPTVFTGTGLARGFTVLRQCPVSRFVRQVKVGPD
jgi:hypothetical protein